MAIAMTVLVGACTAGSAPSSTAPLLTASSVSTTTTAQTPGSSTTTSTVESSATTSATTTTTVPLEDLHVILTEVASGLDAPVLLIADPDGGPAFVVEQPGRIVRLDGGHSVVLDISDDVAYGGERGLLGLAFHPDFAENRLAFVDYTGSDGRTVVEQFSVGGDGTFDVASRSVVLEIAQPAANHNGGMVAFGPHGYLWIGMGDGGGANDQFGNGQRTDTLLGAMLRIAVGLEGVERYAVPADNPFADGADGAPEVWAIGLRNPWRFSFDGDDVWIADVGQNRIEEVSVASASAGGLNYGWSTMEGTECFRSSSCDPTPFVPPVTEYDHGEGCSITGGHVYRGQQLPELDGAFFYSDYCAGFLRSFIPGVGDVDWTPQVGTTPAVSGFGVGGDGELYVVSLSGSVFRLERAA